MFYHPTVFDSYRGFRGEPAALFALPVVRKPAPRVVTALGGGSVASGPAHRSRLPSPYLPGGLRLDRQEGAEQRAGCGSATGCGCGTPRRASSVSGSANCI